MIEDPDIVRQGEDGRLFLWVKLFIKTREGTVEDVRYQSSYCFTLKALCERLAETLRGRGVEEAGRVVEELDGFFSDFPEEKREVLDLLRSVVLGRDPLPLRSPMAEIQY